MSKSINIALVQLNPTVGDLAGNAAKIVRAVREAAVQGADVAVLPEMVIVGYPPEDLVLKPAFQQQAMEAVRTLAKQLADCPCAALVGGIDYKDGKLFNATFLLDGGKVVDTSYKCALPNYGVFDEKRVFTAGDAPRMIEFRGKKIGVLICEDVWDETYPQQLKAQGAEMLVVQNASPYEMGKMKKRREVVARATQQTGLPVVYVNLVGGQDELVFDGRSFVMNAAGEVVLQLAGFEEALACERLGEAQSEPQNTRVQSSGFGIRGRDSNRAEPSVSEASPIAEVSRPEQGQTKDLETVYHAMVLGLRDYVNKNGFKGVVIGLSGGIDSALTAVVAVDALGADRVHGIYMPSPYSSKDSEEDALELAKNLGIACDVVPIDGAMKAFEEQVSGFGIRDSGRKAQYGSALVDAPALSGERSEQSIAEVSRPEQGQINTDITHQNIQARIRGNILMAYSNMFGHMVVTTGNKSEMSVGYATLYGDMCGGYSVLKDVYKTTVYRLAEWVNQACERLGEAQSEPQNILCLRSRLLSLTLGDASLADGSRGLLTAPHTVTIIPLRTITKAPTAELKPNQKDQDTLPPYDMLDAILMGLIERRESPAEVIAQGFDAAVVERVARMLRLAEYKRRQAPPGVKVSGMAFGRDRRYPITNKWEG